MSFMKVVLVLLLALLSASSSLGALPTDSQLSALVSLPELSDAAPLVTCKECVQFVGQKVLQNTVDAVKKACHDGTPPIAPHCPFIKEHPQFFLGWLVAKTTPVKKAVIFCKGAGKCPLSATDSEQSAIEAQQLHADVRSVLSQAASRVPLPSTPNAPLPAEWAGYDESPSTTRKAASAFGALAHVLSMTSPEVTCDECVEYWIAAQLKAAFTAISDYCTAHKGDPAVVARCQAIAANAPFVAGVIYADNDPLKFAAGVCVGAAVCTAPLADTAAERIVM